MQRQLDDISEKEILSGPEKRRIAEELSIGSGVFGALFISGALFLGLLILLGTGVVTPGGHFMSATPATAANATLSPRAVVAMRFYFDTGARRQM